MTTLNVAMQIAMQLTLLASKYGTPTLTAMFRCLEIVFTLVVNAILFNVTPGVISIAGTCLVFTAVVCMPIADKVQLMECRPFGSKRTPASSKETIKSEEIFM